jgi:hypothetical protein
MNTETKLPSEISIVQDFTTIPLTEERVFRRFWFRNETLHMRLNEWLKPVEKTEKSEKSRVLDIGGGREKPFDLSTDVIDITDQEINGRQYHIVDIDYDRFPFKDNDFEVGYSRHTLEDIQNPKHAFEEIIRVSKRGYIETPSPLVECLRGVQDQDSKSCGYIHHRYLVFSDPKDNTLHFIPKYPLIEYLTYHPDSLKRMNYLANHYPIYWNNYYVFDKSNPKMQPKCVVYRHGVSMDIFKYPELIDSAITKSIDYTREFISLLFSNNSNK